MDSNLLYSQQVTALNHQNRWCLHKHLMFSGGHSAGVLRKFDYAFGGSTRRGLLPASAPAIPNNSEQRPMTKTVIDGEALVPNSRD